LTDPSAVVKRLVDDILDLFPESPEAQAAEARTRAEAFRDDPSLTDAQRSRALKDLVGRHPEIVALLPDYPSRLAKVKVRRRASPSQVRSRVESFLGVFDQRAVWIIAVLLLSGVGRLFTTQRSPSSSFPNYSTRPATPVTNPVRWETAAISRAIRDELKASIRRELMQVGKSLDDSKLERVVAGLPVEQLPQVGGMASLVLQGHWTGPVRDRFIARLKAGLKLVGAGLTEAEIDQVAPRCFPRASPRVSP